MKTFKDAPRLLGLVMGGLIVASTIAYVACDDGGNAIKETNPTPDGAEAGPLPDGDLPDASDCFMKPTTHFEIINACTDAVKITKNPALPLLLSDGGLPALP